MSTPRRRVLRRSPATDTVSLREQQRIQKRRDQLEKERVALNRWMARLRRAFHAVEKQQAKISRLERQISSSNSR